MEAARKEFDEALKIFRELASILNSGAHAIVPDEVIQSQLL